MEKISLQTILKLEEIRTRLVHLYDELNFVKIRYMNAGDIMSLVLMGEEDRINCQMESLKTEYSNILEPYGLHIQQIARKLDWNYKYKPLVSIIPEKFIGLEFSKE
jgi:hypothetical protein